MSDYINHILQTSKDKEHLAWCGKKLYGEFVFVDIDHAVYNNINGGRLLPCKKCVSVIIKHLQNNEA